MGFEIDSESDPARPSRARPASGLGDCAFGACRPRGSRASILAARVSGSSPPLRVEHARAAVHRGGFTRARVRLGIYAPRRHPFRSGDSFILGGGRARIAARFSRDGSGGSATHGSRRAAAGGARGLDLSKPPRSRLATSCFARSSVGFRRGLRRTARTADHATLAPGAAATRSRDPGDRRTPARACA